MHWYGDGQYAASQSGEHAFCGHSTVFGKQSVDRPAPHTPPYRCTQISFAPQLSHGSSGGGSQNTCCQSFTSSSNQQVTESQQSSKDPTGSSTMQRFSQTAGNGGRLS